MAGWSRKRKTLIFMAVACALFVVGEGVKTIRRRTLSHVNVPITRPGTYKLDDQHTITIWIEPKTLIRYSVKNADGVEVIRSKENASIVMRWSAVWDEEGRLMIDSSDIGEFEWIKTASGKYEQFLPGQIRPSPKPLNRSK